MIITCSKCGSDYAVLLKPRESSLKLCFNCRPKNRYRASGIKEKRQLLITIENGDIELHSYGEKSGEPSCAALLLRQAELFLRQDTKGDFNPNKPNSIIKTDGFIVCALEEEDESKNT